MQPYEAMTVVVNMTGNAPTGFCIGLSLAQKVTSSRAFTEAWKSASVSEPMPFFSSDGPPSELGARAQITPCLFGWVSSQIPSSKFTVKGENKTKMSGFKGPETGACGGRINHPIGGHEVSLV